MGLRCLAWIWSGVDKCPGSLNLCEDEDEFCE